MALQDRCIKRHEKHCLKKLESFCCIPLPTFHGKGYLRKIKLWCLLKNPLQEKNRSARIQGSKRGSSNNCQHTSCGPPATLKLFPTPGNPGTCLTAECTSVVAINQHTELVENNRVARFSCIKSHINRWNKPESTKKATYKINTQCYCHPHTVLLKDNIYNRIKLTQLINVSKILVLLRRSYLKQKN